MHDPSLVSVLNGLANWYEELESFARRELRVVTEGGQRRSVDELHDEKRLSGMGHPAVEHPGDVGMVHHRECSPLLLEPRQNRAQSMPGLMSLIATLRP